MTDVINALKRTENLEQLYPVLAENRYTAGWNKARRSLWPEPKTEFQPLHWRYRESALALKKASDWIGTDLAERRNLLMFNPVGDNDYSTVRTLVSAYQMIKPDEYARTHRHSPNALRLVLDAGTGLYTVVNGIKLPMIPGDVLLTPGTAWHSHYNEGGDDAYWVDFLDVPLVQLLEPMFYEEYPDGYQPVTSEPNDSPYWFSFSAIKKHLADTASDAQGIRRYRLPSEEHIVTMGLTYLHIPARASTGPLRSTENRIFAAAEGAGTFKAGALTTSWERGDVFAAPIWTTFEITASEDAYVFEVSDEPAQRLLRLHREDEQAAHAGR